MHTAAVGSISHGTLKPDDLLEAFGWELQHISADERHQALAREARELAHTYAFADTDETEYEAVLERADRASEIINALSDALEELAPAYCYFGTLEGDGSDFGFWPDRDAIDELPRIENVDGEDLPDEDHCYVNDHGNVTVYAADGTVILELV